MSCIARLDDAASLTRSGAPPSCQTSCRKTAAPERRRAGRCGRAALRDRPRRHRPPEGWRAGRATGGARRADVRAGRPRRAGRPVHAAFAAADRRRAAPAELRRGRGPAPRPHDEQSAGARAAPRLHARPGRARELPVRRAVAPAGTGAAPARRPCRSSSTGSRSRVRSQYSIAASGRVLGNLTMTSAPRKSRTSPCCRCGRHGILSHTDSTHRAALALPDQGFWANPPHEPKGAGEHSMTDFPVNSFASSDQRDPSIAMDADGRLRRRLAVLRPGRLGIRHLCAALRRRRSSQGAEFRVNTR